MDVEAPSISRSNTHHATTPAAQEKAYWNFQGDEERVLLLHCFYISQSQLWLVLNSKHTHDLLFSALINEVWIIFISQVSFLLLFSLLEKKSPGKWEHSFCCRTFFFSCCLASIFTNEPNSASQMARHDLLHFSPQIASEKMAGNCQGGCLTHVWVMNLPSYTNGSLAYLHTLKFAPRQKVEVGNFAANVAVVLTWNSLSIEVSSFLKSSSPSCPVPLKKRPTKCDLIMSKLPATLTTTEI